MTTSLRPDVSAVSTVFTSLTEFGNLQMSQQQLGEGLWSATAEDEAAKNFARGRWALNEVMRFVMSCSHFTDGFPCSGKREMDVVSLGC